MDEKEINIIDLFVEHCDGIMFGSMHSLEEKRDMIRKRFGKLINQIDSSTKKALIKEIKPLLEFIPEGVDLEAISRINYPVKQFGKVFKKGDDKQPFFSEAYLYNLLGKEDARTLLALISKLSQLEAKK